MTTQFYVYIMSNAWRTVLYTGITNNLIERAWQHRNGQGGKFTAKYNCSILAFYEIYADPYNAIAREKQIKAGSRRSKIELIELMNPEWQDLFDDL